MHHQHHALAVRPAVVGFSVGAAFLYALTSVLQHAVASDIPITGRFRLSLLLALVRRPMWLLSNAVDAGAYVLQFLALRAGSLLVVQTLLVSGLLFALPMGALTTHRKPQRHDWVATSILVLALGLFLAVAHPGVGAGTTSTAGWAVIGTSAAVVVTALIMFGGTRPGARRAAALGAACGVVYGVTAALAKASGHLLDRGVLHALTSWEPYVLVALGAAGVLLSQTAFQAGPLQASLPMLTVADPLVAAVIGVGAFHEHVSHRPLHLAAQGFSIALLLIGTFALSRSPLVVGTHERHER